MTFSIQTLISNFLPHINLASHSGRDERRAGLFQLPIGGVLRGCTTSLEGIVLVEFDDNVRIVKVLLGTIRVTRIKISRLNESRILDERPSDIVVFLIFFEVDVPLLQAVA